MLTKFNRDMFDNVKGTAFTLTGGEDQKVDIELTEVSDLKETSSQQAFSLLFVVPAPYRLEQGLYDLEHQTLGQLQLFLVPVGLDDNRLQMEAVFNLLREKDASG